MSQLDLPLDLRRARRELAPVVGLRITRPWLGYSKELFLEVGRLRHERFVLPGRKPHVSSKGRATLWFDGDWDGAGEWRARRSGGRKTLERLLERLIGRRVRSVEIAPKAPHALTVELDGPVFLRSRGRRGWLVGLRDSRRFPRPRKWLNYDHAVYVSSEKGRGLQYSVCYGPKRHGSR